MSSQKRKKKRREKIRRRGRRDAWRTQLDESVSDENGVTEAERRNANDTDGQTSVEEKRAVAHTRLSDGHVLAKQCAACDAAVPEGHIECPVCGDGLFKWGETEADQPFVPSAVRSTPIGEIPGEVIVMDSEYANLTCQACGAEFEAPADATGRIARCPDCNCKLERSSRKRSDLADSVRGATSATYAVEFKELGPCVEFLDLALRNRGALGVERCDFDDIRVPKDRSNYTAVIRNLAEERVKLLMRLARVPGIEVSPAGLHGVSHTINGLLERVKLVRAAELPAEAAAAVLLFKGDDRAYRDWYTQLLDMGCRDISTGFIEPTGDNHRLSHLLLVGRAPKGFSPPGDWAHGRGWGARALVFNRLRPAEDCKLYVEWGYEYPAPQIERVYDDPQCRAIFVCADAPENDRDVADPNVSPCPVWLRLLESDIGRVFVLPERTLELEATASATAPVTLAPREAPEPGLLELHVQRDARSATASVESIESEIAWHQQAIEDLQRDHRSAHALRREPIYLAYVFEQPPGQNGEPPALNPNFRRLLEQPYGYLQHLRYALYDVPPTWGASSEPLGMHVVIDTRPGSHRQLWTQLASEVYIQRQEWFAWNLPLFVRNGDDLRPRLEDEALVELVRKLIWEDQDQERDVPVLLRTLPPEDGHRGRARWQALYAKDTKPLTACFRFLNDRFSGHLLRFRTQVPADIHSQLNEQGVQLTRQAEELEQAIADGARERVEAAESRWVRIDVRIDEVVKRTKEHEESVGVMEGLLRDIPGQWADFTERVLIANQTLVERKVKSVEEYEEAQHELAEQLKAYEKGLVDVKESLAQDRARLAKRKEDLESLLREVTGLAEARAKHLEEVNQLQAQVQERARRVAAEVEANRREGEAELKAKTEELAELDAEEARVKKLHQEAKTKTQEIRQKSEAIEKEKAQIEKDRRNREQDLQDLERNRQELQENKDAFRKINEKWQASEKEKAQVDEEKAQIDEDRRNREHDLRELERKRQELQKNKDAFRKIDEKWQASRDAQDEDRKQHLQECREFVEKFQAHVRTPPLRGQKVEKPKGGFFDNFLRWPRRRSRR